MNRPDITYAQRSDAKLGDEVVALANVFKFVLDCHSKREAAPESRPDAGKEINERSGKPIIPS
jgi:hypothetical protein